MGLRTRGAEDAVEQESAEGDLEDVRLLYVAATRAKDHLLVSRYRGKSARKALVPKIEQHLEAVELAGEAQPVVRQRTGWQTPRLGGLAERAALDPSNIAAEARECARANPEPIPA